MVQTNMVPEALAKHPVVLMTVIPRLIKSWPLPDPYILQSRKPAHLIPHSSVTSPFPAFALSIEDPKLYCDRKPSRSMKNITPAALINDAV